MRAWRAHLGAVIGALLSVWLFAGKAGAADDATQVYVLAVGSSWYALPTASDQQGLGRVYGANKSARMFAGRLTSGGARLGIVLTSRERNLVQLADIHGGLDRLVAQVRTDRARDPLLVVYLVGHGISEGIAWNHFFVPGTFLYRGAASSLPIGGLSRQTLHAASFIDRLDRLGLPYVVLLDACSEGKEASFDSPVLTGAAIESLRATAAVLRHMNEFHQEHPVLFSTAPGSIVRTVPDPTDARGDYIGPLARRAVIAIDQALQTRQPLTVAAFVERMTSRNLDTVAAPAVTKARLGNGANRPLIARNPSAGRVEEIVGSGEAGEVCCETAIRAVPRRRAVGSVRISGPSGEYISGGEPIEFGEAAEMAVTEDGAGDISVALAARGKEWEINLSTPDAKPFEKRRYGSAQRYMFADAGRPGAAVHGDGRACNEVRGAFTVSDVAYSPGGAIVRLVATIEQYCDDNDKPLTASLDLRIDPR